MKKTVSCFLLLYFLSASVFAQKEKVLSAFNYKKAEEFQKAFVDIDAATDTTNAEAVVSSKWAFAWQVRGEVLNEMYRRNISVDVDDLLIAIFVAYKQAINLDTKMEYTKSLRVDLMFLQTDLMNAAINAYQRKDYSRSFNYFEAYMSIKDLPIVIEGSAIVDSTIIYNTAMAAYKSENWEEAVFYFKESIKYNYNEVVCTNSIYESALNNADTLSAITILKSSYDKYPDSGVLLSQMIKFYLKIDRPKEAIIYINKAIENYPDDAAVYALKGSTLENIGNKDEAIIAYLKAIELDTTNFAPYNGIGIIYYNRGVELLNDPRDGEEREIDINNGIENMRKALPYLEKAYEMDPSQIKVLGALRMIYYRLQMMDKFKAVSAKLK